MEARAWQNAWARAVRPNTSAAVRLFCIPYAGGGASVFRAWARQLPSAIEVWPVQLPGREERWQEPACVSVPPLVRTLADALEPALDRPFAIFGHSMGALVAFELARELRRRAAPRPVALFVSAHHAPHLPNPAPAVHHLPEHAFLRQVQRLNGTPDEVLRNPELRARVVSVLRGDFALCEGYDHVPDAPLECPIAAFGGLHDSHVTRLELEAWREHTRAEFALEWLPGDHFFLHTARRELLGRLAAHLRTPSLDPLYHGRR